MNKSLYFSIFGGVLFYSMKEDEENLDAFQIPLITSPNSSCKKCYGRFYEGYDTTKRHFLICSKCGKKCIDTQKILSKSQLKSRHGNR